ncbi:large ribosomal subunit protein uL1m [Paramormyrops kingsleyae]|uniref:large ribosomal subunit protein uL1m n=1 Tax=Paramormyrops kingsleyae TaxID=1676925 RepID=UPI003B972847
MAVCIRHVVKVVTGSHRCLLANTGHSLTSLSKPGPGHLAARTFAARTAKKETVPKNVKRGKVEKQETVEKVERKIDNTNRHKPYGLTAWEPVDDVYLVRYYPRPVYEVGVAIDKLKQFQQLDFTSLQQSVFMDLKLDMKLEKKKKVDAFVSTVQLPYAVNSDVNKVVVFTEDPREAEVARANGAAFVGGVELVEDILEDKISGDFYVAVPEIVSRLLPLKNKLRKKFPKTKRGSVGSDIPKMLEIFKKGQEYMVQGESYVRMRIATLDMPKEQIMANIETIIKDVCSHKPVSFGPFIERALLTSSTSEALLFDSGPFIPKPTEDEAAEARA